MPDDGKTLREERDRVVEENTSLKKQLATQIAGSGAFEGVTAEQLIECKPEEMAAKAKELHDTNVAANEAAIRKAFVAKGLSGDELDKAVTELLTPAEGTKTPDQQQDADGLSATERAAVERMRTLGGGGAPVTDGLDTANMTPVQMATAGIEASAKARNARHGNP